MGLALEVAKEGIRKVWEWRGLKEGEGELEG